MAIWARCSPMARGPLRAACEHATVKGSGSEAGALWERPPPPSPASAAVAAALFRPAVAPPCQCMAASARVHVAGTEPSPHNCLHAIKSGRAVAGDRGTAGPKETSCVSRRCPLEPARKTQQSKSIPRSKGQAAIPRRARKPISVSTARGGPVQRAEQPVRFKQLFGWAAWGRGCLRAGCSTSPGALSGRVHGSLLASILGQSQPIDA
jgi:hypothetical protein